MSATLRWISVRAFAYGGRRSLNFRHNRWHPSVMLVVKGWPTDLARRPAPLFHSGEIVEWLTPTDRRFGIGTYSNQSEANHTAPATATKGPIEKMPLSPPCSKPSKHSHNPASIMRGAMKIPATRCDLSCIPAE